MKKTHVAILGTLGLVLLVAGCAGTPDTPAAEFEQASFKIIEHKNSTLGGDVPDWTSMDVGELEEDERFEGRYVFRFEETGEDLAGVKTIADNMRAPSEVARLVSTRVEQVFAGAQVGDQDFVETYFENVVKTVSETEINGLRKYGDFWVLKQYVNEDGSPGEKEYAYYTLYTVEEDIVEELIERAIEGVDADTEEELSAKERVRQVLEDEF
ncbi:MAG TPA: hypothetical protein VKA06_07860 [Spirochaetia bacterium]|nr:hypothetical protein [Spirochaetia bacterium]